ncbi:hypothetical protein BDZ90DRAFT_245868 [Jaminaea rosea]|uniref:assimilatory sulfite reductase (NADPH) n=1 Tax=Jaminaea rosea TaxID=1569628 RepID=A0A316UTC2_9BASI|nr:hypothetical protein BDZ90DRAFT_245868 [Jaminaea rosea]PWN28540.1 hypothetical protein BDZ90DRAFT_245868 [Jaminaea rosea]
MPILRFLDALAMILAAVAVIVRDILSSAVTFAGGLALGIGGVLALSRASFAPATRPTKSTKAKVERQLGLSNGEAVIAPKAVEADAADAASAKEPLPLSKQLDEIDAKGLGPAKPQPVKGDGPMLQQQQPESLHSQLPQPAPHQTKQPIRHTKAVAGGDYPEAAPQLRARASQLRGDLSAPAPAHGDALLNAERAAAPVWLTGLSNSAAVRDSTAQGAIEGIAYANSDAMFVYESATNAGFGSWSEKEATEANSKGWIEGRPRVFPMQTRTGAGTAIAGYLSAKGAGSAVAQVAGGRKTVSALTNASGLLAMAPSLVSLPAPAQGRLVLQVSSASQDINRDTLEVKNDHASVLAAASTLSANEDFAIVLSGSRQEAVDVAAASYAVTDSHIVHVFDGAYGGREVAQLNIAAADAALKGSTDIVSALQAKKLSHFSYSGSRAPSTVLVVPNGSHATAARTMLAELPDSIRSTVGVIAARIIRPWSDEELQKVIPPSVRSIFVLDETRVSGATGPLYEDVQSAIFSTSIGSATAPRVLPLSFPQGQTVAPGQWAAIFQSIAGAKQPVDAAEVIATAPTSIEKDIAVMGGAQSRLASIYDADSSNTALLASHLARTLRERGEAASLFSRYDNFEAGGLVRSDLLTGAHPAARIPVHLAAQDSSVSTLIIADPATTLKHYSVFESLKPGGSVLINVPGWDSAELAARLRADDKKTLAAKKARVYLIDSSAVVEGLLDVTAKARGGNNKINAETVPKEVATVVLAAAFHRIHFGSSGIALTAILEKSLGVAPLGVNGVVGLVEAAEKALTLASYNDEDLAASQPVEGEDAVQRPTAFRYNGFLPSADAATVGQEAAAVRSTWALPAWQLLFSEAYHLNRHALRPDLHEKNYVATVTENRRLTPADYPRNVFHMELSTAGTGLRYEVGEALGVHGWNDEEEVRDFINWSGYDPDELLAIPSLEDPSRYETRSVFQILQQRLDIFGKPGKSFYEALSKLATNVDEAKWLRFISSAEGNATFKKLSEVETVTYAECLAMFPSARLPLDVLVREVPMIEPRSYSISSAQAAVGDSVHLLIVTVDWATPSGTPRYGQCTRYLANLKPGAKVTVSVKPGTIKLPQYPTQPVIGAGLGTGLAPLLAIIQARDMQRKAGLEVAPVHIFFGSRSRYAEFLYAEQLEAYERDGLVKLGLAFSRDQPQKIYIQHKVQEAAEDIAAALGPQEDVEKRGSFNLCGPTDPVFDVTQSIIGALVDKRGMTKQQAEEHIETLKEQELWVLETY